LYYLGSDLKPNSEANKKRSLIPDLSGKKLRFSVPDKAIHKSYGNSSNYIFVRASTSIDFDF